MAIVLSSATATRAPKGIFATVVTWLAAAAEAQARPLRREVEKLQAMSDRELADIGVNRADIELRVMSGRSYL